MHRQDRLEQKLPFTKSALNKKVKEFSIKIDEEKSNYLAQIDQAAISDSMCSDLKMKRLDLVKHIIAYSEAGYLRYISQSQMAALENAMASIRDKNMRVQFYDELNARLMTSRFQLMLCGKEMENESKTSSTSSYPRS